MNESADLKYQIGGKNTGGFYPAAGVEMPDFNTGDITLIRTDSAGNLVTRGAVTTDEGSVREGFSGTTLYATLAGTVNFTNGSLIVTGVNTTFTNGKIQYGDYIKLSTDTDAMYAKVQTVLSDTQLQLVSTYAGTTGSGTAYLTKFKPIIGTGGAISVSASSVTIGAGTTNSQRTSITREIDYCPLIFVADATISQRIANQDGYIGLADDPIAPNIKAWFKITGTTNTSITTETSFASTDTETNTVTIPNSLNTGSSLRYRIELAQEYCTFYINDIPIATHKKHLPPPYAYMDAFCGWINQGTNPASNTNLVIDNIFIANANALQILGGFGTLATSDNLAQVNGYPIITGGVNGSLAIGGMVAHDGINGGNPVKIGGRAVTANYTAVSNGDIADCVTTLVGAQIIKPYSIPEADWTFACTAVVANTTDLPLKAAAGAGIKNYLTGLQVKNTNAVATEIQVKDGSTVIWRGHVNANMAQHDYIDFPTPLRSSANAALNFACVTTGAAVYVNAQGYTAP